MDFVPASHLVFSCCPFYNKGRIGKGRMGVFAARKKGWIFPMSSFFKVKDVNAGTWVITILFALMFFLTR